MGLELISANHAAGLAATLAGRANRIGRGFCCGVYPITPATDCMEFLCSQEIEKSKVVRAESEHSAMAVCIGASAAGARSFTATSANGLAYMAENCVTVAGLRLPVVMMVANRTMGPPWNIWADHGDSLMLRDLGWLQFYCADNQEVFDTVLSAYRLAEDQRVMMPAMVCIDGFTLSHTIAQIEVPNQQEVDSFLPPLHIPHQLGSTPHALGQIEVAHQVASHRKQHHEAMTAVFEVYDQIQQEFRDIMQRDLADPVVPYRIEDAETVIISMGTIGATAEQVVDQLREEGHKIGALRIRMLRPFPAELIHESLRSARRVAVIDRDISLGFGGVLWGEIRTIAARDKLVQNYMAGIGGGDVRPHHLVGIVKDVCSREQAAEPVIMEDLQ
ncbi:MAG: transketolase C-terminal domain-containing protein [Desulfocapsaceae bacterium]|nr:transketolase C-terminal domain-containing protein [Desulfocapsaceae bacterium]